MNKRLCVLTICFYSLIFRVNNCEENVTKQEDNSRYFIGCDIAVNEMPGKELPEFEHNMGKLFCLVFERARSERLGQTVIKMNQNFNSSSELCKVETLENRMFDTHVQLTFTVSYNNVLIDAAIAVKEISRLSLSHISATVVYPVVSIYAISQGQPHQNVQWWLILIIIGCCLLICLCGWFALFVYYNTCAMPIRRQQDMYVHEPKLEQSTISDTNVQKEMKSSQDLSEMQSKSSDVPPLKQPNDNISTATILSADQVTNLVDTAATLETNQTKENMTEEIPIQESVADPDHNAVEMVDRKKEREVETLTEIPVPDPWNPYYAGDRVEAIRLQESRHQQHYPQPAYPTEHGVLNLRTTE